jgi:hypothetical protein
MKKIALFLGFVFLLAVSTVLANDLTDQDKDYINHTLYPATVLLYSQDAEGSMQMRCTATAIFGDDKTYQFVTASHCGCVENNSHNTVSPEKTYFFISPDIAGNKIYLKAEPLGCGYRTRGDDYFLLQTDATVKFPIVSLGQDAKILDEVYNVGSPLGLGKQVFTGTVSSSYLDRPVRIEDINWEGAILLQLFGINGGSSGSSLVCADQKAICGFVVGSIEDTTMVAVPVSRFIKFRDALLKGQYKWYVKDPDAAPATPTASGTAPKPTH